MSGVVYFIRPVGADGPIKIGFTTQFKKRWQGLQAGSPVALEVVAVIAGGADLEARLHAAVLEDRSHGEWFRPTERVRGLMLLAMAGSIDLDALPPPVRLQTPRTKGWSAQQRYGARLTHRLRFVRNERDVPADVSEAADRYIKHRLPEDGLVVAHFLAEVGYDFAAPPELEAA